MMIQSMSDGQTRHAVGTPSHNIHRESSEHVGGWSVINEWVQQAFLALISNIVPIFVNQLYGITICGNAI